jgi:hypothetical protein
MATIDSPERIIFWSRDVIRWLFTWSCQAILVLGVTWTWLKLDRRQTSTTRYRIWLFAIMTTAVLPILTAFSRSLRLPITLTPFPVGDTANVSQLAGAPDAAPPGLSWSSVVWPVLFAAWSVGVVLSFYRFGSSIWELHLERVTANPVSLMDLDCSDSDLLGLSNGVLSIAPVNSIEVLSGLELGDKVIISDMSSYRTVNTIKLN